MDNHQNRKRDTRRLTKVRGYPGIFKITVWSEEKQRYIDLRSVVGSKAKSYRAVRRVKMLGKIVQQIRLFHTVDEARGWRTESNPEIPIRKENTYTIQNLVADWREWSKPPRFAPGTWDSLTKEIFHFGALFEIPVEDLSAEDIDRWLKYMIDPSYPKKATRVSFLREVKTLMTILNWYREYKNPRFQPPILKRHRRDAFFKAKPGKPDISLSEVDLERFLERLRTHHRPVYYYLASFQALCGARIGESCGLQWDCVDLQNSAVEIKRVCYWQYRTKEPFLREGTKTGDLRKVVMPSRLVRLLSEWKLKGTNGPFVFHKEGEMLKYPALQNAYKKAYRALGLPVRSTHVMRHTFASIYADQTNDIRAAQAAMGHRDLAVTQHYAKVAERTQRNAIEKFALGKDKPTENPPSPEGAKVISLVRHS